MKGLIKSFGFAFQGVWEGVVSQRNMKIHLCAAALVVLAGSYFELERWEWLVIILWITAVIAAELFNSSLEKLTDLASPDQHPLAKSTKDMAAGAVLITAIGSVVSAGIIFGPRVLELF